MFAVPRPRYSGPFLWRSNSVLAEHFRQKHLASTDPIIAKAEGAVKQWLAMSAEERIRSFTRFTMDAGLARTAADIHVNTGLSFLNSFGATASAGLSRLLNSFPPALQPVAAGELAIPVPAAAGVVEWVPVTISEGLIGFEKIAYEGSLLFKSFSTDVNRSGRVKNPPLTPQEGQKLKEHKVPGEQVVKREDRPIKAKRVDYARLTDYISAKASTEQDPKFVKMNVKHIFGIDKKVKYRASGKIEGSYSGYHHDKGLKLVKKGKVRFLSEPKVDPRTGAFQVDRVMIEGEILQKPHTFFPQEWSEQYTVDKIFEASQNKVKTIRDGVTCLECTGETAEGLVIFFVIEKATKYLKTVYPDESNFV